MNGLTYGNLDLYDYYPVTLYFSGVANNYFQFPNQLSLGPELSFSMFVKWDIFNLDSKVFDFANSACFEGISMSNKGTTNTLTVTSILDTGTN